MNSSLNINLFVNEEGENIYQLDTDFRVYAFVLKRRHILFREHQNQTSWAQIIPLSFSMPLW